MRKLVPLLLFLMTIFLFSTVTYAADGKSKARSIAKKSQEWLEQSWLVDANYEFGVKIAPFNKHPSYSRLRLGATRFLEPSAFSFGISSKIPHTKQPLALGFQTEHLSTKTSAWIQMGSYLNTQSNFLFQSGLGWQVFGVDFEYTPVTEKWMFAGKLRVPITWIVKAVRK